MKYCNNCHRLAEGDRCPVCGNEALWDVENTDFCFLTEQPEVWANIFAGILEDNGIPSTVIPVHGAGFTMTTGTPEVRRIYVPFEVMEQANALLEETLKI